MAFTYNPPATTTQIFSINPMSANPTLKAVMEINGSGFGTNVSNVQVFLSNVSGNVY